MLIKLVPQIAEMRAGESQQFQALLENAAPIVTGSVPGARVSPDGKFAVPAVTGPVVLPDGIPPSPGVTWSVTEGKVSPDGKFTAPITTQTTWAVVTATSTTNPSLQASLRITVTPPTAGSPPTVVTPPAPVSTPAPASTPSPASPPPPSSAGMPVPQLPQVYISTTFNVPGGNTWAAHTSSEFTSALNSANPGDVIVLDPGTTYAGNFILPVKPNPNQQWIYIVSSAALSCSSSSSTPCFPAPGTQVNPVTDEVNMPTIVTTNTASAIKVSPGAAYYRLVGLEITSASTVGCNSTVTPPVNCWSYNLVNVDGGAGQSLPDSITIDRCYLHGSPTQDVREGVIANGTNVAVIDSYISDIHQNVFDSQAILAYYTPGPIKIVDNYLSATTENIMFGGAGGADNPYVPSDIEIRNNYLFKPLSWVANTIPPGNQWVVKNLLEFKSARRVLVDNNTLENCWKSGQLGHAIDLTVRTGQSGNLAVVDDISITNNIIENVASGFSTLYQDYSCGTSSYPNCTNPGEAKRIGIFNNVIIFRSPELPGGARNWGLTLSTGMTDFLFQHNTMIPAPETDCGASIYFELAAGTRWPPAQSDTHNVWILDNVLCRQPTGDDGAQGTAGLNGYMGDPSPLNPRFLGNVMYVSATDTAQTWPPQNDVTTTPFVYVNSAAGDFQLATAGWNTNTSDGNPPGVNETSPLAIGATGTQ